MTGSYSPSPSPRMPYSSFSDSSAFSLEHFGQGARGAMPFGWNGAALRIRVSIRDGRERRTHIPPFADRRAKDRKIGFIVAVKISGRAARLRVGLRIRLIDCKCLTGDCHRSGSRLSGCVLSDRIRNRAVAAASLTGRDGNKIRRSSALRRNVQAPAVADVARIALEKVYDIQTPCSVWINAAERSV